MFAEECTMSEFTVTEFQEIVHSSLGAEEASAVQQDTLDISLADLGIDSLGVLEIVNQIRGKYSADLDDNVIDATTTPRATIELVQALLR